MHSVSDNGFVCQDPCQPAGRKSTGCMALLTAVLDVTEKTKNQLDKVQQAEQSILQHR